MNTAHEQPSNRIAMLLSVLPGMGHVYLDHTVLGAMFFAFFITSLNMVFLGTQLRSIASETTETLWWIGVISMGIVWIGSIYHTYLQSYGTDRLSLAQNRELLLRSALVDYLRDDLEDSVRKLEHAIELDVDWQDPDPLFHLGVVSLRLAERKASRGDRDGARTARRRSQWAFRTCLARDATSKWRNDIGLESKRMRRLLSMTGRLRMVTSSGRFPAVTESGSFPELRESGSFARPGSMTMEKLREAQLKKQEETEGQRAADELRAELESVAELPRTRRTSRPFKAAELRKRLAEDGVDPGLLASAETVDLQHGAEAPDPRDAEEPALPEAVELPEPKKGDSQRVEAGPPPTRKASRAELLAKAEALAAQKQQAEAETEEEEEEEEEEGTAEVAEGAEKEDRREDAEGAEKEDRREDREEVTADAEQSAEDTEDSAGRPEAVGASRLELGDLSAPIGPADDVEGGMPPTRKHGRSNVLAGAAELLGESDRLAIQAEPEPAGPEPESPPAVSSEAEPSELETKAQAKLERVAPETETQPETAELEPAGPETEPESFHTDRESA